jgi:protocatechuate 3,4-dioxygenase beta subunit
MDRDDERPCPRPRRSPPGAAPVHPLSRRDFARGVAGGLAAALVGACGRRADAALAPPGVSASAPPSCTLYPRQTEGPYYLDVDLLRRDVRDGRTGAPLRLELQVVSAASCAPLEGLVVDIWHCDAAGRYSGYPGQPGGGATTGETFLRGSQITAADGRVRFDTIYPGWYPGRTTHVHFKVHLSATSEATSQLYFPEEVTAAVYAAPPYAARGRKDTSNAADGVARGRGGPTVASVFSDGAGGQLATLVVGVAA